MGKSVKSPNRPSVDLWWVTIASITVLCLVCMVLGMDILSAIAAAIILTGMGLVVLVLAKGDVSMR